MHITMGEIARIMHEVRRAVMGGDAPPPFDDLPDEHKTELIDTAGTHMSNPNAEVDPDDREAVAMQAVARAITTANQ